VDAAVSVPAPPFVPHGEGWSAWPAPAKLNLFLRITGRRADGYHLLQTVFQLLDRGDTVHLRPRTDGMIHRCRDLPGIAPEADLARRAAHALREASGCVLGADIAVEKRIPAGGGLGGGSSDAATVLVALDALWGTRLGEEALAALALGLGADVPVFVRGRSAWAEGVGERLTPLELPPRWYVVVDPGIPVPTAGLFADPQLTRDAARLTIPLFASALAGGNAFEPVVRRRFPPVARALDWLSRFGEARLSGSGGCLFVATDSEEAGLSIVRECPPSLHAFVARGVADSPLRHRLATWQDAAGAATST
jgi:4-diphosphocytidyl-2-C-methyl-D-erythritol kinase